MPNGPALLYDADRVWFPAWPVAAWGLVAGLAGAALLLVARRGARRSSVIVRAAATVLAILGPAWAVVIGAGFYGEHARLRAALRARTFSTVEGIVHDRFARDGSAWLVESGRAAHWYGYAASRLAPGYHRAGPGTGGLRDGDSVRIADVDGRIARVERYPR
jgi:hypothetical protein